MTLLEDAAEQAVLRRARAWRDEGSSLRTIQRRLNDGGVPSKTGRAWSVEGVRRLVRDEAAA